MSLTVVQRFRFCHKCQSLFFAGAHLPAEPDGLCPSGGEHEAMGYVFDLKVHETESPTAQARWRYCGKCWAMYFDGYQFKGRCPAGGGHQREERFRHNFAVPHSVPGTPSAQTEWRFCNKCHAMFYNGYTQKGRCAAGGEHFAQGYDFVLPHQRP